MLETAELLRVFADAGAQSAWIAAQRLAQSLGAGGKLLTFGNGGSAADAQHLAAELVNRYRRDRRALAAVALTTDTSTLTAIGNDVGFDAVFERQVAALGRPGDVVVGITTSGRSENVRRGLAAARDIGCYSIALTGNGGVGLAERCDLAVVVPSGDTPRVQECHLVWLHALCECTEALVAGEGAAGGA